MAQTLGTLLIDVKADTQQLVKGFNRAESAVNKTTKNMTTAVKTFAAAYLSLNAIDLAKTLSNQADAMTNVNSKLKLVTSSTNELVDTQQKLFNISQKTRSSFTNNVDLYQRIAFSTKELNLTQEEQLKLTEQINKELLISGTNAAGAATLITQLGQAFSSNFQAVSQEINTLKDQAPSLYQTILKGTGATAAEFKKLAEDGKLSSRIIIDAISSQAQATDKNFNQIATTIDKAYVNVQNSTQKLIGNIDNITGASEAASKAILNFSNTLENISDEDIENFMNLSKNIALVGGSIVAANLGLKAYNVVSKAVIATNLLLGGSFGAVNRSILIATASQVALNKVLKATPFALATSAVYLIAKSFQEATDRADTFAFSIKQVNAQAQLMPFKERLSEVTTQLIEMDERLKGYNETQKMMYKGAYDSLYREKKQLEENIRLIEEKNKKTNESKPEQISAISVSAKAPSSDETKNTLFTSLASWQTYYESIGDYSTSWLIKEAQLRNEYIDLSEQQFSKLAEIAKTEYFDKIKQESEAASSKLISDFENLSIDFKFEGLGDVSKSLMSIESIFKDINKEQEAYDKAVKATGKDSKKQRALEQKHSSNQIAFYGNLSGAMSAAFEEGSKEAAAFQAVEAGLAIVSGVRAILSQGSGDPYTAFARMAAMAAAVSSLLSSAKIAFNSSDSTPSSTSMEYIPTAYAGNGTVLGDASLESESISNSLDILSDYAKPEFNLLSSMDKSLRNIEDSIAGVVSMVLQQAGFALGGGFTSTSTYTGGISDKWTESKLFELQTNADVVGAMLGVPTKLMDKIGENLFGADVSRISSDIAGLLSGAFVTEKILKGLFGGGTTYTKKLVDSGLTFSSQLLTQAMDNIYAYSYQTIKHKKKTDGGWGRSDKTKKWFETRYQRLNNDVTNQFEMILSNYYDAMIFAGESLDENVDSRLNSFRVNLGKIKLKGKTGSQITEALTNAFGRVGDQLARYVFPNIGKFQQVGEGSLETLTRVAAGIQESEFYIKRLGGAFEEINYLDIVNKQGNIGFEALAQSIIKTDEAVYGLNNGVVKMVDVFSESAEELYTTYLQFENIRDVLIATGHSASDLSSSMVLGAGGVSILESATQSYIDNFLTDGERLNIELERLSRGFKVAGYELPATRKDFINLINSIDTSTEEGAEAYGRLISLSNQYNDTISEIEESTNALIKVYQNLSDSVQKTIDKISMGISSTDVSSGSIIKFWDKYNETLELSRMRENLSSEQQSRLSTLVSEVNQLSLDIQSQDTLNNQIISNELIGSLSNLKQSLDFENEILSVQIVGIDPNVSLASYTGLNSVVPNDSGVPTYSYTAPTMQGTEVVGLLSDIKNALGQTIGTNIKDIYDIIDDVTNGNNTVKVEQV